MTLRNLLLAAISVVIATTITNIASADNGLTFPPVNVARNYQYPPQAPVAPGFNRIPTRPAPYVFGQSNPQPRQQMISRPMQTQNFARLPVKRQVTPIKSLAILVIITLIHFQKVICLFQIIQVG